MTEIHVDKSENRPDQELNFPNLHKSQKVTGIIGVLIWIFFVVGYFFLYNFFVNLNYASNSVSPYSLFAVYLLILGGYIFVSIVSPLNFTWKDLKLKKPAEGSAFLFLYIGFFVIALYLASYFLIWRFNQGVTGYSSGSFVLLPNPLFLIWFLLFSPVLEELFFRQIIIEFGSRFASKKSVYIFSGIVYYLMYFSMQWMMRGPLGPDGMDATLISVLFSISLSMIREMDDSIFPCILTHFLYNLCLVVFPISINYIIQ
ncbi:lysostaphin resistance A-like protein [Promethearchaeum syntrophicum]|uniref:Lysostaphin resistance A-like protein n=1 Tax=Promethearchaeum syntrophicum TaxID=2594042 RepID=A0A5B9DEK2_9ARCH|nr:type II CAAX endopeptidase family protein [Candidatus Prometheoarchaeum syntrophicum]QEE17176.1 CAAX amino terminal protease self- immunity [Candidatus Prometheoarchaeum syntrophicum]